MADDVTFYDAIEGYCGKLSYAGGDEVSLHVSCTTEHFDVEVHRWGATIDLVWQATDIAGVFTPAPEDADSNGCGWPSSLSIPVRPSWRSGFYLVTLTARGADPERRTAYACFVVRAAKPTAKALLVIATNTYNAYNNWGGKSLYTGGNQVSFERPFGRGMLYREAEDRDDRKARPVRWGEEPDADGDKYQEFRMARGYPGYIGSSGWFTFERRFVEWAEAAHIELDYAVSSDLEQHPEIVDGYPLVLGVGHDEYWSSNQRDTVESFVRRGGNYVSLSGNTIFWQVRLAGSASQNMVCHKYSAHESDPVMGTDQAHLMTGMWSDPLLNRPETAFLGAGSAYGLYHRFGQATPRGLGGFMVYRYDHWLFAETGLRYGDVLGAKHGVVGYETAGCRITFDDYQLPVRAGNDGTPEDMEIVAFTPSSNLSVGEYPKSISALSDQGDLEFVASRLYGELTDDSKARVRYGNATMSVARPYGAEGGEVVTVGTTDWVFGLGDDDAVDQVTFNILDRYLPA